MVCGANPRRPPTLGKGLDGGQLGGRNAYEGEDKVSGTLLVDAQDSAEGETVGT